MNAEQIAPARADRIEERGGKYVVVSKESGRTFGTYATRGEAEKRLAQIEAFSDDEMMRELDELDGYARKGDKYEGINFSPPEAVANAAKRGLDYRKRAGGRGGLTTGEAGEQGIGSGVARAMSLSNGGDVSPATVRRMAAFFSRHEKNKAVAAEHKDEPWKDA